MLHELYAPLAYRVTRFSSVTYIVPLY